MNQDQQPTHDAPDQLDGLSIQASLDPRLRRIFTETLHLDPLTSEHGDRMYLCQQIGLLRTQLNNACIARDRLQLQLADRDHTTTTQLRPPVIAHGDVSVNREALIAVMHRAQRWYDSPAAQTVDERTELRHAINRLYANIDTDTTRRVQG